jgi:hemoglobin
MQPAEQPCLYDKLGGVYSIVTVVDEFIDRIMADPRLNANPWWTKRIIASRLRDSSTW